jgi:hypothetical protein
MRGRATPFTRIKAKPLEAPGGSRAAPTTPIAEATK